MKKNVHFIGIGGVGMSALAQILIDRGDQVSGSDLIETPTTLRLQEFGAKITIGHFAKNIKNPNIIVYSSGIPSDNPEILQAQKKGIPVLHRSELLTEMLERHTPLLVTGTHGKTTTACLLAHLLVTAGYDPSYAIGGFLHKKVNSRHGRGVHFIAEADESDGTFTRYPAFGAIITNLEYDHTEFWKSEADLIAAFKTFAKQVGSKRHLFWCYDDKNLRTIRPKGWSYGFTEGADLVVDNFQQNGWNNTFDITFRKEHFRSIDLPLIGAHNVLNAASVFGLGVQLDIPERTIREAFTTFQGVGRRLERKGEFGGITIFDDYAHHPTEIFSTLRAIKAAARDSRVIVAFQPHRYTRTKQCLDDFADAFAHADEVILTDIYAANEKPLPGVTSDTLMEQIQRGGYRSVRLSPRPLLISFLQSHLREGDVLVTMGAGDITQIGPDLLRALQGKDP